MLLQINLFEFSFFPLGMVLKVAHIHLLTTKDAYFKYANTIYLLILKTLLSEQHN